ncbi:flagellar hook-basal body protein FliE [Nocardioides sp. Root1257]|uniref:flagellar hook-basal body complex protein FliE n=1 Tax=unclassified Nocardioides TaxID=2615069 RepID=UPI0006FCB204|nr:MULTISPECIES: flagellar hook-basal body complex protein FliE [unclassified Nocardioides]KQW42578.1 flagellar hook-basal body protein FliE [Nocardioides sp. Root1257]KRC39836.1 flagellar hook-basal body protein FliE [Nocardioides sp. Root224]
MSVSGIESIGFQPYVAPTMSPSSVTTLSGTSGTKAAGGAFGDMVLDGLDRLESVQDKSDKLAVQAATGDLNDIHDYTVAATEASVTAQLTVAVRNRALEAFNEIMRMPIG